MRSLGLRDLVREFEAVFEVQVIFGASESEEILEDLQRGQKLFVDSFSNSLQNKKFGGP